MGRAQLFAAGLVLLGLAGCQSVAIGLSGRPCDGDGTCLNGYSCDTETNICITKGDTCEEEDRLSPCGVGVTDCTEDCRRCVNGAWTDCLPAPGNECDPGIDFCDGDELVVCDAGGFISNRSVCTFGCDDSVTPQRCNECVRDTVECHGLLLVTCGPDGLVTNSLDCDTGSPCTGAGACDAVAETCEILAQAPDGSPCGGSGTLCDGACAAGVCVVGGTVDCDDGDPCTGPDNCDPDLGCYHTSAAMGTACGDLCTEVCDGSGTCIVGVVDCDDSDDCTGPDTCTANSGCNNPPLSTGTCDDGDVCTDPDTCNAGLCVPGPQDGCDDTDACTVDACIAFSGCDHTAVDCSGTAGDCHEDNVCNPMGAEGNCDAPGPPIVGSDGLACNDCLAGPSLCDTCNAGVCEDLGYCDGTIDAAPCVDAGDCAGDPFCDDTPTCSTVDCVNEGVEHQACSDTVDIVNWSPSGPCVAVDCSSEADNLHADAVGENCYTNDGSTATVIQWEFITQSPDGTPFNLWMRNAVDTDWGGGQQYDCTLTGVDGGTTDSFSFVEANLDDDAAHGGGCGNYAAIPLFCWMAADGDDDPSNGHQPIILDQGTHLLDCTFPDVELNRAAGYDGLIYTANLSFVPLERDGPLTCDDNDQFFTSGACVTTNWGPNVAHSDGRCSDAVPTAEGVSCNDCAAGDGRCQDCRQGVCLDAGLCDGASDVCVVDSDCADYGGLCASGSGFCSEVACVGGSIEHHACADVAGGVNWGPGLPCEAVSCPGEDIADGAGAIGGDCYTRSVSQTAPEDTEIRYTFTTESPSGTLFNLWMRNTVDADWDVGEQYDCVVTGVTGVGTYAFSFVEGDLDNDARHGGLCGDYGATSFYCWMAADGDDDTGTFEPIALDVGQHLLSCTIGMLSTDTVPEDAGFDGFIFTNDLGFVPWPVDGARACDGLDERFSDGTCYGTNWGPDRSYAAGFCSNDSPLNEYQTCDDCALGSGSCSICRDGVCLDEGLCDGSEDCVTRWDCWLRGAACDEDPDDCEIPVCNGGVHEHQLCADSEDINNWGPGQPCQAVVCNREDAEDHPAAIGADCHSSTPSGLSPTVETTEIQWEFNTQSPDGTLFNLWLRNIVDANWSAGGNPERYSCFVTGVTGAGVWPFEFYEVDLDGVGRHGFGCGDYGVESKYCWMAVDSDSDPATYAALPLDQGLHALHCEITMNETNITNLADAGFDGLIFTTDLAFVPQERLSPVPCSDDDETFTDAACPTTNWGSNSAPVVGLCGDDQPWEDGQTCTTCASGTCSFCRQGVCLDEGLCDGSEVCTDTQQCHLLAGACVDGATDCTAVDCAGVVHEHQACADTEDLTYWADGQPCEAVACIAENSIEGGDAIGEDCFAFGWPLTNASAEVLYTFNTQSPAGTPFNIWMRNVVDQEWETNQGDYYHCFITGVTDKDTYPFAFTEEFLRSNPRHGTGCGAYSGVSEYCWMAADGDPDPATYDPIRLDPGEHRLSCTISLNSENIAQSEDGGFDGMIFTTDLGFVPLERDGPLACGDSDEIFTGGDCDAVNWGPNLDAPAPGACVASAPDRQGLGCGDCASGTCSVCRYGACMDEGVCDASELCFSQWDCEALGGLCADQVDDCLTNICSGGAPEHFSCADTSDGTNWGPTLPCRSVVCAQEDSYNGDDALGQDCASSAFASARDTEIEYEFYTASPSSTLFNIWMRNRVDNDSAAAEAYFCTIDGVSGVGLYSFDFFKAYTRGTQRHGTDCAGFPAASEYCWMAVDGDGGDLTTYAPLPLDQGVHRLVCSISISAFSTAEDAGFDGLIFTSDLAFVPESGVGPGDCGDSDLTFSSGSCAGLNWGPNTASVPGVCDDDDPLPDQTTSCNVAGGDTCCNAGVCTDTSAGGGVCP